MHAQTTNTVRSFAMATLDRSGRSKRPAPSPTPPGSVVKQLRSGREVVVPVNQRKTKQAAPLRPPSNTAVANDNSQRDIDESEDDGGLELDRSDAQSVQRADGSFCGDDSEDDDGRSITPFTVVESPKVSTPISSITSTKSPTDDYESPLPRGDAANHLPKGKVHWRRR